MSLEVVITPQCEVCKADMRFEDEIEILHHMGNVTFAAYVCTDTCGAEYLRTFNAGFLRPAIAG